MICSSSDALYSTCFKTFADLQTDSGGGSSSEAMIVRHGFDFDLISIPIQVYLWICICNNTFDSAKQ